MLFTFGCPRVLVKICMKLSLTRNRLVHMKETSACRFQTIAVTFTSTSNDSGTLIYPDSRVSFTANN